MRPTVWVGEQHLEHLPMLRFEVADDGVGAQRRELSPLALVASSMPLAWVGGRLAMR